MKREYKPQPIYTSEITLPDELLELTEKIAKNTQDVWAAGRMKEGWKYGEVRDAANKLTPCMVEYDELTESEKEYDRNTSLETIKLILKLGYKIVAPGS